jgi:hypothetical protein
MNNAMTMGLMALFCAAGPALAQQQAPPPPTPSAAAPAAPADKAAHPTAQSEAGEPRADTSSEPVAAPAAAPSAAPASSTDRTPTDRTPAPGAPAGRAAPASGSGQKPAPRTDRLELGTATVTGDREQPKVMYVVPWKRSDIGDLTGKPMNSLVDEILAPVDRDVFKREVVYYNAVQADTSQNGAPPKPGQQGEK